MDLAGVDVLGEGVVGVDLVEGVLLMMVACLGLAGNILSFVVLNSQKVQKTFHNLLILLNIFDLVSSPTTPYSTPHPPPYCRCTSSPPSPCLPCPASAPAYSQAHTRPSHCQLYYLLLI